MPEISRFYGIVIRMWPGDHPAPHFHANYAGQGISVEIRSGRVLGDFPPAKLKLVLEWLELHRAELMSNWALTENALPPRYIEPLE